MIIFAQQELLSRSTCRDRHRSLLDQPKKGWDAFSYFREVKFKISKKVFCEMQVRLKVQKCYRNNYRIPAMQFGIRALYIVHSTFVCTYTNSV